MRTIIKTYTLALLWLGLLCGGGWADGIGGGGLAIQSNLNAAADPSASNDQTQGYSVGSIWQNSLTGRIWVARSVSSGVAVWTLLEFSDHPGYIASNWYLPFGLTGRINGAAGAPGSGTIHLLPGYVKERLTINNLGVRITTLSAGGNVQAAIYANNATTGRPTGNALASTASMSTAATGSMSSAVSIQIDPGLYWFATNCDNGTAVFNTLNVDSTSIAAVIGSATQSTDMGPGQTFTGIQVTQTFGTWPSLTSASFTENTSQNTPLVQFEVGSIP